MLLTGGSGMDIIFYGVMRTLLKGSAIGDFFGEWGREAGMYVLLGDSVLVLFAVLVAALVDRANARGQAYITLLGLFALCVAVHLNAPRRKRAHPVGFESEYRTATIHDVGWGSVRSEERLHELSGVGTQTPRTQLIRHLVLRSRIECRFVGFDKRLVLLGRDAGQDGCSDRVGHPRAALEERDWIERVHFIVLFEKISSVNP